jgi:hypothetical protein
VLERPYQVHDDSAPAPAKNLAPALGGVQKGYDPDLSTWSGPAIALAVDETKAFEAHLRQPAAERKEFA